MKKIALFTIILALSFITISCDKTVKKNDYVRKVALSEETIAVGIYKATGYEYSNIKYIAEALKIDGGIVYVTLSDEDVLKTKLENIDVLVFPALKNGQVIDKLDPEIANILKEFISKKGVIGFTNDCNILLKSAKCKSLGIVDVDINEVSKSEFYSGIVNFNLSEEGKKIFPELIDKENLLIGINNRSRFQILDTSKVKSLGNSLANSDNPLFVITKYKKGKIFITTTQAEITPGMRWMIPRIVRWTFNKDFIYYDTNVFRPDVVTSKVKLTEDIKNKLEDLLLKLDDSKKDVIISAMDEIQEIYPMIAAEKVHQLLIEKNDDIMLRAAKYLVDIEYTLAIDDLKKLIKKERSKKVREQLVNYQYELENMLEQN